MRLLIQIRSRSESESRIILQTVNKPQLKARSTWRQQSSAKADDPAVGCILQ